MAIYSMSHRKIGRSTHPPGTAAAHVRYIARKGACSRFLAARAPATPAAVRRWISDQEAADRKNARVLDKIMVALPRELTLEQQDACLAEFCERLTRGRAPWFAAIHRDGTDAHNPHAHVGIRDRDPTTRKRVIEMSEKGSTDEIRFLWQDIANAHLAMAGHEARIDCRSLADQGKDRLPQIHVGPPAAAMEEKGVRPESAPRVVETMRGPRRVDYPALDEGHTRAEINALVVEHNRIQGEWRARKRKAIRLAREVGGDAPAHLASIPGQVPPARIEAARQGRRYSPGRLTAAIALYQAFSRLLHRVVGWIVGNRRPPPEPTAPRPPPLMPPALPPETRLQLHQPPPRRRRALGRKPTGSGGMGMRP